MDVEVAAWVSLGHATAARQGRISMSVARRVLGWARPYRARLGVFIVVSVAASLLAVASPLLAGAVVDLIVTGGNAGAVVRLAVLIGVVALVENGIWLFSARLAVTVGEGLVFDLRNAVFDHVQRMPVAFFNRTRTGALVSRLNNDVSGAQRAFSGTLSGLVSNTTTMLATLIVMLGISWRITLLALLVLPLFIVPSRRMGRHVARLERESADHHASMSNQMAERFSAPGATLVKLYGVADSEVHEFATRTGRVRDIGIRTAMVQFSFVTALTVVSSVALALVYGLGGVAALRGDLDTGALVSMSLLLARLYSPLVALAGARVEIMTALVSFERVFEVLDLPPLVTESPTARPVPDGPVSVEFADVGFRYPSAQQVSLASLEEVAILEDGPRPPVLTGVSFVARPGQLVALVGSSGAGKSTIAQLVPRLYDVESGSVRIGGVDVRDLTAESLRGTVGLVTQDGHLFHDTIRANLLIAKPDATESDLWIALHRARLFSMVTALPAGLDTVMGERGYRMSGGERQRLTIARLLLARPRVVVLDEATAHLDSDTEAAIQAALTETLADRTTIVIAHRLATVRAADVILVLERGWVVERGTHPELLAAGGRYAVLYRTQFDDPDRPARS
jgi:ATP-binding cassette subfamily B protein